MVSTRNWMPYAMAVLLSCSPNGREGDQLELSQHGPQAELISANPRLQALWVNGDSVYAIEDHFVYLSTDGGTTFVRLGRLPKVARGPIAWLKDGVARSWIVRRVRGYPGPSKLVVLGTGTILVFYDGIYRSTDGGRTFEVVARHGPGLPQPFPYGGIAVGPGDTVYFGEYTTAPRPHAVRIVRGVDDGRRWSVIRSLDAGQAFHIHGIFHDPHRGGYWIATGDRDWESALLWTNDGFLSIDTLGSGSQEWRLVDLVATKDRLLWGSDDDQRRPQVLAWDFAKARLDTLHHLDNPSYFAARLSDGTFIVSTTHEPGSRFTLSEGPPAATSLWASRDGQDFQLVARLPYLPDSAGGKPVRPRFQLPMGPGGNDDIIVTPFQTRSHHFSTLRIRLAWSDDGARDLDSIVVNAEAGLE